VPGLTGADEDAFVFTPSSLGVNTAGTYGPGLFVDGSMFGIGGNDIMGIDLPSSALLAAGSMGSGIVPGLSPVPMGMVLPGPLTVSIDGNVTAEQRDRIRGAIDVLNGTGAMLTLADTTSAAIRLHHGAISPCGGMSAGVLGCATAPGDITLIAGWNWYTGSDTNSIGSDQYDYQTIVTHELAHIVGLHHSDDPSSALYHSLSPGVAHRDLVHDAALEDFHAHDLV
jgi:hypothetical protein